MCTALSVRYSSPNVPVRIRNRVVEIHVTRVAMQPVVTVATNISIFALHTRNTVLSFRLL